MANRGQRMQEAAHSSSHEVKRSTKRKAPPNSIASPPSPRRAGTGKQFDYQAEDELKSSGPTAQLPPPPKKPESRAMCALCTELAVEGECQDCALRQFCSSCLTIRHKRPELHQHRIRLFPVVAHEPTANLVVVGDPAEPPNRTSSPEAKATSNTTGSKATLSKVPAKSSSKAKKRLGGPLAECLQRTQELFTIRRWMFAC
jgi:hypothetical protein